MATVRSFTLAEAALPADLLDEMERMNGEAADLHIWLRTRANAPMRRPWHEGATEPAGGAGPARAVPHLWKWDSIVPYLHRIAAIAPLDFTDRQQFLLTNPGFGGQLKVTNTIRVAVSIYKPGDVAPVHMHTPNASRTILSEAGGYTLIEGERCTAARGDLILTPNGTWHGHGNDDAEPVIWMDVLDWPLIESLDAIWIRESGEAATANAPAPAADHSRRFYGAGGIVPRFAPEVRGEGRKVSPMFHFAGRDVMASLHGMRDQDGSPWEGINVEFVNPLNGAPVFATLGYGAQLLRPGEATRPFRHTASTLYTVLEGRGVTEVNGRRLEWGRNDIFVVPGHLWRRHVNQDASHDAVLYSVTDAPLLKAIGHYRAQGRSESGDPIELCPPLRRRQAEPFVAAAQPPDDGHREDHHPRLAHHLSGKEVEPAEGEVEERHAVDHQPDDAAGEHGQHQPAALQRCIDAEIGEFRDQEGGGRGQHQRRRRHQGR
jgi:gentisate 1,2-dioxygenase